jgi:hypothetical protein
MTCLDKRREREREREIKQGEKGDHILIRTPDFVVDFMRTDTSRKDASSSGEFFFFFLEEGPRVEDAQEGRR